MPPHSQDALVVQPGDKVRVRRGPYAGMRGVVRAWTANEIEIETADQQTLHVDHGAVTNYSLAARKAWKTMPKRAGRPSQDPARTKQMVSMRLSPDVWRRLGEAVDLGLVRSREDAVNTWVSGQLDALFAARLGPPKKRDGDYLRPENRRQGDGKK